MYFLGEGVTHIYPVTEGRTPFHAVERYNFGGIDATNYLVRLLKERGIYMRNLEKNHLRANPEELVPSFFACLLLRVRVLV